MDKLKFIAFLFTLSVSLLLSNQAFSQSKWFYLDCTCGQEFQEEVGKDVDRGNIYLQTNVFSVPEDDIGSSWKPIEDQLKEALSSEYNNYYDCRYYDKKNQYGTYGNGLIGPFDSESDAERSRRATNGKHNQYDHVVVNFQFKYY